MEKFWKRNKTTIILISLIAIGIIIVGLALLSFLPKVNDNVYGNRLDGIEAHSISDDDKNTIVSKIKENEITSEAKVTVTGKIINVFLNVKEGTEKNKAMELSNTIITYFKEDDVKFYDIQIYVKEVKEEGYTMIGYKNNISDKISWNKQ